MERSALARGGKGRGGEGSGGAEREGAGRRGKGREGRGCVGLRQREPTKVVTSTRMAGWVHVRDGEGGQCDGDCCVACVHGLVQQLVLTPRLEPQGERVVENALPVVRSIAF